MRHGIKLALLLILCIGAFLRLWNLETTPQWDYDEGVNMNIAWNLANGRFLLFNLIYSFVPHPPLFFIILGVLLKIFGNWLIVIRALTAFYGILTILLIYLICRELLNERLGLLASFLFAIYPNAIFFGRMGFANNQVMFLGVLAFYSFLRHIRDNKGRWLYVLSISTGLAMITEFIGIAIFPSILLLFWIYDRKDVIKVFLISITPPALFAASMLILMPNAFIHDFLFQFERLREYEGVNIRLLGTFLFVLFLLLVYYSRNWIKGLYRKIADDMVSTFHHGISQGRKDSIIHDNIILFLFLINIALSLALLTPISDEGMFEGFPDYFMLGIAGTFLINEKKARNTVLLFFLPILFLIIKINRTDHMVIPLYPYFAIGLAVFLYNIYGFVNSKSNLIRITVFLLLSYPFAFLLYNDVSSFILGNGITVEKIEETISVAGFINRNSNSTDLVITGDSHLARFINAKTTDFSHSVAIEKKRFVYMDYNLSDDRFVFNSSYRNAKFFISKGGLGELNKFRKNYRDINEILNEIELWPVLEMGNYSVYRNPGIV